jgi:hypothetical protein
MEREDSSKSLKYLNNDKKISISIEDNENDIKKTNNITDQLQTEDSPTRPITPGTPFGKLIKSPLSNIKYV